MPRAPRLAADARPTSRRPLPPMRARALVAALGCRPAGRRRAGGVGCGRCAGRSSWRSGARWRRVVLGCCGSRAISLGRRRRWMRFLPAQPGPWRIAAAGCSPRSATWWASRCGISDDMPAYLPAAAVAVEDHRFWHHPGIIDLIGLGRAAVTDLLALNVVQGGSTHYAAGGEAILFLTNARTLQAQGAGTDADVLSWSSIFPLARDPRDLAEPGLPGLWRLGTSGRGGAHLFRGFRHGRRDVVAGRQCWRALPRAPSRFNPRSARSLGCGGAWA